MKLKYILFALLVAVATESAAKRIQMPHVYMFGFSASFRDSVVYITDIQDVQGAWMEQKTNFLVGRDNYSYQLRDYLAEHQQQPQRVCVTIYATSKKKAEKKYLKLRKKYVQKSPGAYDVRYLSAQDFKYEPIDMSPEE